MRKKIIPPIGLDDYKVLQDEVDAIYLAREEISKIYKLDLSKHLHLIDYRGLFVLGCLTGLRYSDFCGIRQSDICLY
ncbi:hypothetical protein [Terrimonas alba]|uniref:hypothetical protein n=1 Tax=Terrimonas alba TaxID=3349636 RepID=UPI0035F3BB96